MTTTKEARTMSRALKFTTLKTKPQATPNAKTLATFRQAHDPRVKNPAKIRAALKSLAAEGPESWEYEADFCRRAMLSHNQISPYRDEFAAHIVEVRPDGKNIKCVWFASAKVAAKARE
jgi:hypothetical protein